ncbi:MAG: hypothetical protein ACYCYM_02405 [Saccharofermentanales bacterium]
MFNVNRRRHRYRVLVALPVLIALIFSVLFVAFEFSDIGFGFGGPDAGAAADMADRGRPATAPDGADAAAGAVSLSADSVLKISWLSISFIGQAFCGGLFSRTNPRAASGAAAEPAGSGIAHGHRLTSSTLSDRISDLVSRQVFSLRISRLTAG